MGALKNSLSTWNKYSSDVEGLVSRKVEPNLETTVVTYNDEKHFSALKCQCNK